MAAALMSHLEKIMICGCSKLNRSCAGRQFVCVDACVCMGVDKCVCMGVGA